MKTAERLIDVAVSVGDGAPIDWLDVESRADVSDGEVVRQLKLVERIAAVHASFPPLAAFEHSLHDSLSARFGPPAPDNTPTPARWGPLTIVRKIGSGTYADVYEARDPRLDRPVALKLLRHREVGAAAESEAIEEARLLARVRHPNVVTVYGAERIDGRAGIWMELVDGQTLEQELRERGPFPPDALSEIGLALCGALKTVHAAGLLHRDVKAQNVMRSRDGRVLLTDFGTGRETENGTVGRELAGTPLYLAPEVLAGQPASVSSDVYSLGVLLHHLATGSFPVRGRSLRDLHDAQTRGATQSLRTLRPELPKALAAAIDQATALDQRQRWASIADLETALARATRANRSVSRRTVFAAAALLLTGLGLGWLKWPRSAATDGTPRWVLVSAFENHTSDPRLDNVLQFVLEQELAQSPSLSVVSRERLADALRLMRRTPDAPLDAAAVREACVRDGGISMVAAGRIDRVGGLYTVSITLEDVRSARALAQAAVDVSDVDAAPRAVRTLVTRVRTAMGEAAARVEADTRLEPVTTGSLEALRAYTRGMSSVNGKKWAEAEAPLREAVRLDPTFASAEIMLAHTLRNQQRPTTDYMPFAEHALHLSANLPSRERNFIAGSYYDMVGDQKNAIAAFEAVVNEYPNDYWSLNNLMASYSRDSRWRDAVTIAKRLAMTRPNDFVLLTNTASGVIRITGDLKWARPVVARAEALDPPPGPVGQSFAAWVELFPVFDLWAEGRIVEAAARLDALASHARIDEWRAFGIGQLNLSLGRVRAAEAAFATIPSDDERQALLGYAAMTRGDAASARAALLRAGGLLEGPVPPGGSGWWGRAFVIHWSLTRAGLADQAVTFARRGMFENDITRWIDGKQALAHGNVSAAVQIFEHIRTTFGSLEFLVVAEDLAEIYERRGDLNAAEAVLMEAAPWRTVMYPNAGSFGYMWLRLQAQLLELERRMGHHDRADRIARELRQTLQVADSDFGLLRGLD